MRKISRAFTALAALSVLATSAGAGQDKASRDIIDTALEAGSFGTLAAALTEADLVDVLQGPGPFTVFAPTDEAFAKLPAGTVESLLKPENRDQLVGILTYHVADGRRSAERLTRSGGVRTLNGQRLELQSEGESVLVGDARVTTADIETSNGIIHVVDTVLLPESKTIVGVARAAGSFGTLLAAAEAAGLADALTSEGPFTVFAPTDDAFAKLPAGTVESLLLEENRDQLRKILQYHVVPGRAFSDEVLDQRRVETLAGLEVEVSSREGIARINESQLVATDINAANGVIHVIDSVLLPPEQHSSVVTPAELIEMAIRRGAPLYNHGNAAACAAVYEMTANALVSLDAGIPAEAHRELSRALAEMSETYSAEEQAWIMRRGLDRAYAAIHRTMSRPS